MPSYKAICTDSLPFVGEGVEGGSSSLLISMASLPEFFDGDGVLLPDLLIDVN